MYDNGFFAVPILLMLIIVAVSLIWHYSRSASMLQKWADENGCQINHKERRYLRRGPFFWTTSRSQEVFYVEVLDRNGASRTGFVRCGGRWLGMMTEQVEARWNE